MLSVLRCYAYVRIQIFRGKKTFCSRESHVSTQRDDTPRNINKTRVQHVSDYAELIFSLWSWAWTWTSICLHVFEISLVREITLDKKMLTFTVNLNTFLTFFYLLPSNISSCSLSFRTPDKKISLVKFLRRLRIYVKEEEHRATGFGKHLILRSSSHDYYCYFFSRSWGIYVFGLGDCFREETIYLSVAKFT